MSAYKKYRFSTIEQALTILVKDSETGKYLHFYQSSQTPSLCDICSEAVDKHFYNESTKNNQEDVHVSIKEDNKLLDKNDEIRGSQRIQINNQNLVNKNLVKINIPQAALDDFEDSSTCNICFLNKLSEENEVELSCKHKFCQECVTNYLTININDGKV